LAPPENAPKPRAAKFQRRLFRAVVRAFAKTGIVDARCVPRARAIQSQSFDVPPVQKTRSNPERNKTNAAPERHAE
jgi:hypothetical protein